MKKEKTLLEELEQTEKNMFTEIDFFDSAIAIHENETYITRSQIVPCTEEEANEVAFVLRIADNKLSLTNLTMKNVKIESSVIKPLAMEETIDVADGDQVLCGDTVLFRVNRFDLRYPFNTELGVEQLAAELGEDFFRELERV